jgi:hypothetical protein
MRSDRHEFKFVTIRIAKQHLVLRSARLNPALLENTARLFGFEMADGNNQSVKTGRLDSGDRAQS